MRILILSPFFPSPDADHAGGVVLWRTVQGLAARHEVSLLSFVSNEKERERSKLLSDCCSSVRSIPLANASAATGSAMHLSKRLRSLAFSPLPYDVWRFRSQAMTNAITDALKVPFDIVQVEFVQMGQYINSLKDHPHTILREYDLTFTLCFRRIQTARSMAHKLFRYIQWRRMRDYELSTCRTFHKIIVPSPQTKAELLTHSSGLDVSVVPFGVSLPDVPAKVEPADGKRVLFVGAMGRPQNVEAVLYFYDKIWPRVRTVEPDAEFWIVGSGPLPQISQLAREDESVKVTGFVDDLTGFYARASVFVAPILVGGGVVTRILNAMVMSRAVVTTSIGNEGIGARPGHDLLVADEPEEFARQIVDLLRDQEQRRRIGRNGRMFVETQYSWDSIIA